LLVASSADEAAQGKSQGKSGLTTLQATGNDRTLSICLLFNTLLAALYQHNLQSLASSQFLLKCVHVCHFFGHGIKFFLNSIRLSVALYGSYTAHI